MTVLNGDAVIAELKRRVAELVEKPELEYLLDMKQSLTELGIDSMRIIQLIVAIESRYDITFEDDELVVENFANLQSVADKVFLKCGVLL